MRFIGRKFHAVLDYTAGIVLIAAPWLLGFAPIAGAAWVAVIVGIALIGMSLLTDYEGGALKIVPMSTHLTIDVVAGLILAASPWLFGFYEQVYAPHLILGILEIGAGLFTVSSSQHTTKHRHNRAGQLRGAH
ncbi:SPW repeat-containing protein [Parapedobacter composti]|uniref:SPW repeat-containing protein n=1 Tax=Parapedobacter composti TaxID=623281 RepID=A0A1I1IGP6_9SPHI|nr:SPW repeat protein [Parapedobacter composti]SFC35474.1 SPW repeat-containing protein [Parapedobacter composti]